MPPDFLLDQTVSRFPNFIRVTLGPLPVMEKFIDALRQILPG